ncbi:hypothetical protein DFH06DRAFT_1145556 [Mycena polygramma]|nr:hypothetical protein DFH06DRAFT_1145556 [Mycena polygramma]
MAPSRPHRAFPLVLPRITEPYSDMRGQYPSYRWPTVKRVETARARHNRIVCGLRTQYEEAKRTSACIKNERDRYEGSYEQMVAYHRECSIYEDAYGKFVPDSENARWFDRINPRIAEMLLLREVAGKIEDCNHPDMVRYFVAVNQAQAFEEDFEHGFNGHDANDRLDQHFKRMASHTASAKSLALKCSGDALKLAAFFSKPLEFTIDNPYEEGETRTDFDDRDFDTKLREIKRTLEGDAAVEALPPHVLKPFPFSLSFTNQLEYYDAVYAHEQLTDMSTHHWEDLRGEVGEDRVGRYCTPAPRRPALWSDEMYARLSV